MKIETLIAPNPSPYTLDGTRTYVIYGAIVVDPGPSIDSHLDAIVAAAPKLAAIFVTHRHDDHAPAAEPLRARTGAPLYAPTGAVPDAILDHEVVDRGHYRFGELSIEAIATPGHTAEHFCYLTPDGELFTGDTVLGEGTTVIFPPDGDMGDYMATLQKLIDLQPRMICPGHGPLRSDAIALLQQYLDHRRQREKQVLAALAQNATVDALRKTIYPDLDARLHLAAELQIEAHLLDLQRRGVVQRDEMRWSS